VSVSITVQMGCFSPSPVALTSLLTAKPLPHVPTTSPMPAQAHGFIWLRQQYQFLLYRLFLSLNCFMRHLHCTVH
jgi:hypothetical protein